LSKAKVSKKATKLTQDPDEVSWQIQDDEIPWDDTSYPTQEKKATNPIPPRVSSPNHFPSRVIPPREVPHKQESSYINLQLPVFAVWMMWVLCAAVWVLGVAPWEWYGVPELFYFWGIGGILTAIAHFAGVTDWGAW
jgi:hypothetical protein